MRIGIWCQVSGVQDTLGVWLQKYCALYELSVELVWLRDTEELFHRNWDVVLLLVDTETEFQLARRLREEQEEVRLVCLSHDTHYQIPSLRIHASAYLLWPATFPEFVRVIKRAGVGA